MNLFINLEYENNKNETKIFSVVVSFLLQWRLYKHIQKRIKNKNLKKVNAVYISLVSESSLTSIFILNKILKLIKNKTIELEEFTIEIDPLKFNKSLIEIFLKNKINRISINYTLNTNDNFSLENKKLIETIQFIKENFDNYNFDFFSDLYNKDLLKKFLLQHQIKHISYLTKNSLEDLENLSEAFLMFRRYEYTNFSINKEYDCLYLKQCYLLKDTIAIGLNSNGFENNMTYKTSNKITDDNISEKEKLSKEDLEKQILFSGLSLLEGIELNNNENIAAYNSHKETISDYIIKNKDSIRIKNFKLYKDLIDKLI